MDATNPKQAPASQIVSTAAVSTINYADQVWEVLAKTSAQWFFLVQRDVSGKITTWIHVNINSTDGKADYYALLPGEHGPIMVKECDRSLAVPGQLTYQRPDGSGFIPEHRIAGIIVKSAAQGSVIGRFSMTNARNKNIDLKLENDGTLHVDGKAYYLYALVQTDKNRIENYDAFFSPQIPVVPVTVYELENLPI